MLNRPSCALLACVSLLLTSCSRENESSTMPAADAGQAAASETQPTLTDPRSTPPAVRPPSAQHPTAVVIPANDPSATLSALTQAVRKFTFEKRQPPASLEELVTAGYVRAVPPAPAGKKFVIDKKRMVVELANK